MRLIRFNNEFIFECKFGEHGCAKAAGFHWNRTKQHWATPDWRIADKIIQYADDEIISSIKEKVIESHRTHSFSVSSNSGIEIPCPAGLAYMPFQKAFVEYYRTVKSAGKRGILLADQPGLGKTIQTVALINDDDSINRVLVVCPASIKLNWEREIKKWITRPLTVSILGRGKKKEPDNLDADILIVNYDIVAKLKEPLQSINFDIIVCDESHNLKNSNAARTSMILGGFRKANSSETSENPNVKKKKVHRLESKFWLLMTGTPILNRPQELWTTVSLLDKTGVGSDWLHYHKRYCGAKNNGFGYDISGATNQSELQDRLRGNFMIRRLKEDVLKDLPEKIRTIIPLDAVGKTERLVQTESALAEKKHLMHLKVESKRAKLKEGETLPEGEAALVAELTSEIGETIDEMTSLRKELAIIKAHECIDLLVNAAESEPVLIFTHHHECTDTVVAGLESKNLHVGKIDGRDAMDVRQAMVDDFQNDKLDALVLGIKAAGVGLTLTKSAHAIFLEMDWTPGAMQQAEDRSHRHGQTRGVQIDYLVYDNSIDAHLCKMLHEKEATITLAMDNTTAPIQTPEEKGEEWEKQTVRKIVEWEKAQKKKAESELRRKEKLAEERSAGLVDAIMTGRAKEVSDSKLFWKGFLKDAPCSVRAIVRLNGGGLFHVEKRGCKIYKDCELWPDADQAEVETCYHLSECACCGRPLTDPESIRTGIGPTCAKSL